MRAKTASSLSAPAHLPAALLTLSQTDQRLSSNARRCGILAAICAGIGRGADTRSPDGFLRPTFRRRPARRLIAYSAPAAPTSSPGKPPAPAPSSQSALPAHQPHTPHHPQAGLRGIARLIRPISPMIAARSNIFSTPKKIAGKNHLRGIGFLFCFSFTGSGAHPVGPRTGGMGGIIVSIASSIRLWKSGKGTPSVGYRDDGA